MPDMAKMNKRLMISLLMSVGIAILVLLMKSPVSTSSSTMDSAGLDPLTSGARQRSLSYLSSETTKKGMPSAHVDTYDSLPDVAKDRDMQRDTIRVSLSFPNEDHSHIEEDYTQLKDPIPGFPFNTNKPVIAQSTISDMITETQRLHFLVFNHLIGPQKYIIHVDIATHENKGDSAIGVGEVLLFRRLKKEVIFYCGSNSCGRNELMSAKEKAMKYGPNNVAVLCHGGGNIVSYPAHDAIRSLVFSIFKDFKTVVFPQSIWLWDRQLLEEGKRNYSMYPNVTLLMRDAQSLKRGQEHFSKNNLILCPDMAFQIGNVPRSMGPQYDIIWIKRTDPESSNYNISSLESYGLTIKIDDWIHWMPSGLLTDTMEKISIMTEMGFTFLMRGRVAITDRLHGHIMSTMLHMPHVLLDTSDGKLAAYHNTWTKGLEGNTVLVAKTPQEAVDKARELLERFKNQLPTIASYMHLKDGVA